MLGVVCWDMLFGSADCAQPRLSCPLGSSSWSCTMTVASAHLYSRVPSPIALRGSAAMPVCPTASPRGRRTRPFLSALHEFSHSVSCITALFRKNIPNSIAPFWDIQTRKHSSDFQPFHLASRYINLRRNGQDPASREGEACQRCEA